MPQQRISTIDRALHLDEYPLATLVNDNLSNFKGLQEGTDRVALDAPFSFSVHFIA